MYCILYYPGKKFSSYNLEKFTDISLRSIKYDAYCSIMSNKCHETGNSTSHFTLPLFKKKNIRFIYFNFKAQRSNVHVKKRLPIMDTLQPVITIISVLWPLKKIRIFQNYNMVWSMKFQIKTEEKTV